MKAGVKLVWRAFEERKSVEMGDRQFFADFYRMNASPAVFSFFPLASFITTGLFLFFFSFPFLVYLIPSHSILITHLFLFFAFLK